MATDSPSWCWRSLWTESSKRLLHYVLTAVDGGGGEAERRRRRRRQRGGGLLPSAAHRHGFTIRVLDSNDNVPAFDQPVYTVSLPELAAWYARDPA